MTERFELLAQSPLGLENTAADEMRTLGLEVREVETDHGIILWRGTLDDIARAHHRLRCVERIAAEVASFRARAFGELKRKVAEVEWSRFFGPDDPVLLRVTSRGSKLYHERAIAERVHEGIAASLGRELADAPADALDDDPRIRLVLVRFEKDRCTIRVDASGTRLHRRGYRLETAKAPLRETLAANILRAANWEPGTPLQDPFCGSGTFLIEAAMRSLDIQPGHGREFAYQRWPLAATRPSPEPEAPRSIETFIAGSDRDAGAVRAAQANAERAGVSAAIQWDRRPVSECVPVCPRPGRLVTNPPYGARIGDDDLLPLYAAFGRVLHERFGGWSLTMLCADPSHAAVMELPWTLGPWLNNGGLRVRLIHADVPGNGT